MKTIIFGNTSQGLPIPGYRFGETEFSPAADPRDKAKKSKSESKTVRPEVLILGGVHGDEIEGVVAAHGLLGAFISDFPYNLNLTLVPAMNLDGVLTRSRVNARGVDLNRNLPTKDWSPEIKTVRYHPGESAGSEIENQNLMTYLEMQKPNFALSLHSWHPILNVNGLCLGEANMLSKWTGYRVDDSIGYPTPGCLGTYAGLERGWPTLTYEIERGLDAGAILKTHVPAILECLKVTEGKSR